MNPHNINGFVQAIFYVPISKRSKKREGRKPTGLLSVHLEAGEQGHATYDALVEAGYTAPKDEFGSVDHASELSGSLS